MPSLNKSIIIGHLGKDPEVRTMQNGNRAMSFSVATSETWKDKASGERKERTEWHNIVIVNQATIGFAEGALHKGSLVYVEGKLQTRKWQAKDGTDRYTTEIVVGAYDGHVLALDRQPRDAADAPAPAQPTQPDMIDDSIPFDSAQRMI